MACTRKILHWWRNGALHPHPCPSPGKVGSGLNLGLSLCHTYGHRCSDAPKGLWSVVLHLHPVFCLHMKDNWKMPHAIGYTSRCRAFGGRSFHFLFQSLFLCLLPTLPCQEYLPHGTAMLQFRASLFSTGSEPIIQYSSVHRTDCLNGSISPSSRQQALWVSEMTYNQRF